MIGIEWSNALRNRVHTRPFAGQARTPRPSRVRTIRAVDLMERYASIMEFAAGPPSRWVLTLKSGSEIELWADSYSIEDDHYLFDTYVHASLEEQRHVEVTSPGRGGTGKENVLIVAAKVPVSEVDSLHGGPVEPDDKGTEA